MRAAADGAPALTLLPEPRARAVLGARPTTLRLLRPAYEALGVGTLRVLRVREVDDSTELVVGYERYVRAQGPAR
jgi:hypothetical protein